MCVCVCTYSLFEAHCRVLWSLPQSVGQSSAGLRVLQLDGLDPTCRVTHVLSPLRYRLTCEGQVWLTCVVEVSGPLVVVGELGEHGFGHELLGLVVQVEVQVVPQQQVEQHGLTVGVVPQRRRAQPGVQEAERSDRQTEPLMTHGLTFRLQKGAFTCGWCPAGSGTRTLWRDNNNI